MTEEEIIGGFVEELIKQYDYNPLGIGKGLAFLYENLDYINILMEKK